MDIHLVKIDSDICADHFTEGEGDSTGCGYNGLAIGKTFPSMKEMLDYLASYFSLSDKETDYEKEPGRLLTAKTVADHTAGQNGGWFQATPRELAAWRKGTMKLFSENFTIHYHYVAQ